jgi:hypothetical protein
VFLILFVVYRGVGAGGYGGPWTPNVRQALPCPLTMPYSIQLTTALLCIQPTPDRPKGRSRVVCPNDQVVRYGKL